MKEETLRRIKKCLGYPENYGGDILVSLDSLSKEMLVKTLTHLITWLQESGKLLPKDK